MVAAHAQELEREARTAQRALLAEAREHVEALTAIAQRMSSLLNDVKSVRRAAGSRRRVFDHRVSADTLVRAVQEGWPTFLDAARLQGRDRQDVYVSAPTGPP